MKSIAEAQFSPQVIQKLSRVHEIVQGKRIIVAYSGGIDSTLVCVLMKEYAQAFLAVFIRSPLSPSQEFENAHIFSQSLQFSLRILDIDILGDPSIQRNEPYRCYYCKQRILTELHQVAHDEGYDLVADGTNFSDLSEERAGLQALKESGTISPLAEVGLTKPEIIEITRILDLPSQTVPSQACLASRIPFNLPLTSDLLTMVDQAEQFLIKLVPSQEPLRVRLHQLDSHGNFLARIEGGSNFFSILQNVSVRTQIATKFQELGFVFATFDVAGFQSGSMHKMHHD